MLVITRKKNEQLIATAPEGGGNVVITVVEIRDDRVRIGVECAREWAVHRREVYDQIHGRDNESSTT